MTNEHAEKSSLREKIIEHVFVGEVLKALWRRGIRNIEVLKPEVDARSRRRHSANSAEEPLMEVRPMRRISPDQLNGRDNPFS